VIFSSSRREERLPQKDWLILNSSLGKGAIARKESDRSLRSYLCIIIIIIIIIYAGTEPKK
jgi:hypothetical protein